MMFRNTLLLATMSLAAVAQDNKSLFTAAPPEVEKALRDRVSGFYQAYVDGKFRQAEQYVAEDTKDLHYNQEKNKYRNFEIVKITFDDKFKTAKVVTIVGTNVSMRGNRMDVAAPMASHWKLEDGKWFYYYHPSLGVDSPVGIMRPGPGTAQPGTGFGAIIKNPMAILSQIKVSKKSILLKGHEKSEDTLTVTNNAPGPISLAFQSETAPGLSWKLDKPEIAQGQTATLTVSYLPPDKRAKPALRGALSIEPFGQTVQIPVEFDIPDEVKKQLPKAN